MTANHYMVALLFALRAYRASAWVPNVQVEDFDCWRAPPQPVNWTRTRDLFREHMRPKTTGRREPSDELLLHVMPVLQRYPEALQACAFGSVAISVWAQCYFRDLKI